MEHRFDDQVVVVTGATSGIGRAIARAFADAGATVVGTGRDQVRLTELGREIDLALSLELRDAEAVELAARAILDRHGRVDVLVNNAGIGLFRDWRETTPEDVARLLDVNLLGAVRITRALLPAMVEAGRGTVVNIASVAGRRGYARQAAYCASKHAMLGWGEALRCDLAGTGVRVVQVLPPAVRTPFFENAGYTTFDEDHPRLRPIGPERVAEEVLDAVARGERQRTITLRARVLQGLSVASPRLLEFIQRFK